MRGDVADRFISLDSEVSLDADITSREYGLRDAEDVIHDEQDLFAHFAVDDAGALTDTLQFDGDVLTHPEGLSYTWRGNQSA